MSLEKREKEVEVLKSFWKSKGWRGKEGSIMRGREEIDKKQTRHSFGFEKTKGDIFGKVEG